MPIVNGWETFCEAMSGLEDDFVLIGGAACSILLSMANEEFRATKDLDIVVLTDANAGGQFARRIWSFIKANGYKPWKRINGKCVYYRFDLPTDSPNITRVPEQIELFARHPDFPLSNEDSQIAPLPFDEDISSLSVIVLDEGYYEFIKSSPKIIDGIRTLSAVQIIPLKMRAHIDLKQKHENGAHVNEKDLTKHRSDVFKLSKLLTESDSLILSDQMRRDAESFLDDFEDYSDRQTNRKTRSELHNALVMLRRVYLGGKTR